MTGTESGTKAVVVDRRARVVGVVVPLISQPRSIRGGRSDAAAGRAQHHATSQQPARLRAKASSSSHQVTAAMLKRKRIIAGQSSVAAQSQASSSSAPQGTSRWSRQVRRRQSSTPPPPAPLAEPSSRRRVRREDTVEPQAASESSEEEDDQPAPKPKTRLDQLKEYQQLAPFAASVLEGEYMRTSRSDKTLIASSFAPPASSTSQQDHTRSLAAAISSYSQAFYASRGSLRREPAKKPRGRSVKVEAEEISEDELEEAVAAASDADAQSEESYRDDEEGESSDDGRSDGDEEEEVHPSKQRAQSRKGRDRRTSSTARCNMTGAFDDSAMFVFCECSAASKQPSLTMSLTWCRSHFARRLRRGAHKAPARRPWHSQCQQRATTMIIIRTCATRHQRKDE